MFGKEIQLGKKYLTYISKQKKINKSLKLKVIVGKGACTACAGLPFSFRTTNIILDA